MKKLFIVTTVLGIFSIIAYEFKQTPPPPAQVTTSTLQGASDDSQERVPAEAANISRRQNDNSDSIIEENKENTLRIRISPERENKDRTSKTNTGLDSDLTLDKPDQPNPLEKRYSL